MVAQPADIVQPAGKLGDDRRRSFAAGLSPPSASLTSRSLAAALSVLRLLPEDGLQDLLRHLEMALPNIEFRKRHGLKIIRNPDGLFSPLPLRHPVPRGSEMPSSRSAISCAAGVSGFRAMNLR